jgi:hypothetical protein
VVRPGRSSTQEVMKPPLCDEGVFVDYLCAEYLCLSLLASIADKDRGEVLLYQKMSRFLQIMSYQRDLTETCGFGT